MPASNRYNHSMRSIPEDALAPFQSNPTNPAPRHRRQVSDAERQRDINAQAIWEAEQEARRRNM
jgi:hypothetical protein